MRIRKSGTAMLLVASLLLASSSPASALRLGFEPKTVPVTPIGDGCPFGSAKAIMNGDTVSVLFSGFEATAVAPSVESRSCTFMIGILLPWFVTAQPISMKYNGFADVPSGGSARADVRVRFEGIFAADTTGFEDSVEFGEGFSSEWERNVPMNIGALSACNVRPVPGLLRIETVLSSDAASAPEGRSSQVRVDSLDSTRDAKYEIKFRFKKCLRLPF